MRSTTKISIGLLAMVIATHAAAEDIYTGPVNGRQLQKIVDSASPGDTIRMEGGVYRFRRGVFIDKALRFVADDPADRPILEGESDCPKVVDLVSADLLAAEKRKLSILKDLIDTAETA